MDCEKFDLHLIDELYDELDEVTHAAMKRHGEGCARCAGVLARLRATREVGVLPLVEPSDGFESRVLTAAYAAQRKAPWHRKVMRAVAWAGSHAMRPQLAMAAVLVMCLGASLMLLRAPGGAPVRVTERGEPTPDTEQAPVAVAEPPAAATAAAGAMPADREAERGAAEGKSAAKEKGALDGAEASKDKEAAMAALSEARAVRSKSGCSAAVSKFDDVGVRFAGTAAAADAMWEAASCYKQMGNNDRARELYVALRNYGAYKDRAEAELQLAAANTQNNYNPPGGGAGPRQGVAAAPMPRAAPAKKPSVVAADPFDAQESPAPAPAPPSQAPGGSKASPAAPRKDQGL